ncbi:MAG: hypothetical protein EB059_02705 [Alphaproteobacteria bacterium]|nr:hypothetical protein [Alphaproteobacteria bacterium]
MVYQSQSSSQPYDKNQLSGFESGIGNPAFNAAKTKELTGGAGMIDLGNSVTGSIQISAMVAGIMDTVRRMPQSEVDAMRQARQTTPRVAVVPPTLTQNTSAPGTAAGIRQRAEQLGAPSIDYQPRQ